MNQEMTQAYMETIKTATWKHETENIITAPDPCGTRFPNLRWNYYQVIREENSFRLNYFEAYCPGATNIAYTNTREITFTPEENPEICQALSEKF